MGRALLGLFVARPATCAFFCLRDGAVVPHGVFASPKAKNSLKTAIFVHGDALAFAEARG